MALLATGKHDRKSYTALLFALRRGAHSGTLTVKYGRRKRELLFIAGEAVLYRSDLSEDSIERTLVSSNLVPADRVKWIIEKLGVDESVETALVMSGAVSPDKLAEHKLNRLPIGIGSPFVWRSGEWNFSPLQGLISDRFDPALLPKKSGLNALWKVVRKEMATNDVMMEVSSGDKGRLFMAPNGESLVSAIAPDEPLSQIVEAIGDGCSVEDLFGKVPDSSGDLFKLLWMLEAGGVVLRENVTDSGQLDELLGGIEESETHLERADSAVKVPKKSPPQGQNIDIEDDPTSSIIDEISDIHESKMGTDFYEFLGIDRNATRRDVDKACKSMAKMWRPLEGSSEIDKNQEIQVKELLAGVQLVWRTLTDPKHKKEYDRRLETGRAPLVEVRLGRRVAAKHSASKPDPSKTKPLKNEEVVVDTVINVAALIESKKYLEAQSALEDQRVDNPTDPIILASLGWVSWLLLGETTSSTSEDPIEFIDLALTFDSRNLLALEYKAKILLSKGANSQAKAVLNRLLTVEPRAHWAKTALDNIGDGGANSVAERKRRFWRNKGDR